MTVEYIFWCRLIKRSEFHLDFFWNKPQKLIRVVVNENQIKSDDLIEQIDGRNVLVIDLLDIIDVSWSVSTGGVGCIKLTTKESGHYYFKPVNPLDPTLTLVVGNADELIAFCDVVNALKNGQIPEHDENPYTRQIQKEDEDKPKHLRKIKEVSWDKNVSPWKYYYEFVPASVEKKRVITVQIFQVFVLGGLGISVLIFLYALITNFKW